MAFVAEQLGLDFEHFADYGQRQQTVYEHAWKSGSCWTVATSARARASCASTWRRASIQHFLADPAGGDDAVTPEQGKLLGGGGLTEVGARGSSPLSAFIVHRRYSMNQACGSPVASLSREPCTR
ncbi:hypothetical protein AB0M50_28250 [Nonomuraea fuscirosea]|uniref:hypothetical protein n=1 Tax=Nonomuraea fuscirosea TaxID=1291556 RepID=UPI003417AEA1